MGRSVVDELIVSPEPHYDLPRPATYPEFIAAAMMVAGHGKAGDLGVLSVSTSQRSPLDAEPGDRRRLRLVEGGPGDNWAPRIASAMLMAGRAAAEELSSFRLANQRIGFLRFAACADSQSGWHGGKVSGYGER